MRRSQIRMTYQIAAVAALLVGLSTISLTQITDNSGSAQPNAAQQASASAQAAAPAPPPQICGNTAFCYEANDFAATVTSFRITTDAAKRQILDLSIRFQNKTNQQLVLGYVNASGNASDDRGNRLVPWGPNASRGLGLVYGSTFDPKFVVRPAGFGDAQFEFFPQGYPQVVGFTYTLDLSIAEINTFEGNQHTLGEEFPLHFQGLRNGSASVSPGFSPGAALGQATSYAQGGMGNAMSNPCGAAGSAGSQVASTVSNASNAISSIGSLFKKNKNAQNGQATSIPGCDPNATTPMPSPTPAATSATPASRTTNAVQQAVSKTPVAQPATTNPLNPLAAKPAQATVPVSTTKPASAPATPAATRTAPTAPVVNAKSAAPVKPAPAKPAKPQAQKPANTTGN